MSEKARKLRLLISKNDHLKRNNRELTSDNDVLARDSVVKR